MVSQETRQRLVSALILSTIDYGNVIFAGLPGVTLAPLRSHERGGALRGGSRSA